VLTDKDQGFMRLLGLELGPTGPQCQRFAGVVDNGILLRLKVEASPGDLKLTHVQNMLADFKTFFGTN
jgi:peroxiredoxin